MYNLTYPMELTPSGAWSRKDRPVVSRVKFLLDFSPGQYVGYPDFGSEIKGLEQLGAAVDELIRVQLLELREAIGRNVPDIEILGIAAVNNTLTDRSIEFVIQYRETDGSENIATILSKDPSLST